MTHEKACRDSLDRVGEWLRLLDNPTEGPMADWQSRHRTAVRLADAAYEQAPEGEKWVAYHEAYTAVMNGALR